MNLITKLLMENEADILFELPTVEDGKGCLEIKIGNIDLEKGIKYLKKKELLAEVPEQFYVSELEWMLMNYWKENGVKEISIDSASDMYLWNGPEDEDGEIFYQEWSKTKLFKFLNIEECYSLKFLIEHSSLIEG